MSDEGIGIRRVSIYIIVFILLWRPITRTSLEDIIPVVCNGTWRHEHRGAISEKIKPNTKMMFDPARNARKRKVGNRSTRRNRRLKFQPIADRIVAGTIAIFRSVSNREVCVRFGIFTPCEKSGARRKSARAIVKKKWTCSRSRLDRIYTATCTIDRRFLRCNGSAWANGRECTRVHVHARGRSSRSGR